MTIKIAQFSDIHYSAVNLDEADRCLTAAVGQAIDSNVDCAIFTGDSTDAAMNAHQPSIRALAAQVQRMANHCPVLMLQGTFSHEPKGLLAMIAMVGAKYPIMVAETIGTWGLTLSGFEPVKGDGEYSLLVHALPTLNKADIAAMTSNHVGESANMTRNLVVQVLESWAPVNNLARAKGVPTMVISHGTVVNSISEHGVPMAGSDHEFSVASLFSAQADAVALGHIHLHQHWMASDNGHRQLIAYAGSLGRYHYGEVGDKYWLEWCMEAGNPEFIAHATPSRQNIDMDFVGPPDMEIIQDRADECAGAYVRIRYEVDQEIRHTVSHSAIKKILEKAAHVQIEGKTLIIQRQRASGISKISLPEKLRMWCEKTASPGGQALQDRLETMLHTDAKSAAKLFIDSLRTNEKVIEQASDEAESTVNLDAAKSAIEDLMSPSLPSSNEPATREVVEEPDLFSF